MQVQMELLKTPRFFGHKSEQLELILASVQVKCCHRKFGCVCIFTERIQNLELHFKY